MEVVCAWNKNWFPKTKKTADIKNKKLQPIKNQKPPAQDCVRKPKICARKPKILSRIERIWTHFSDLPKPRTSHPGNQFWPQTAAQETSFFWFPGRPAAPAGFANPFLHAACVVQLCKEDIPNKAKSTQILVPFVGCGMYSWKQRCWHKCAQAVYSETCFERSLGSIVWYNIEDAVCTSVFLQNLFWTQLLLYCDA